MGKKNYTRIGQKWSEADKYHTEKLKGEKNEKINEIARLEKRIRQLYRWIDSHVKNLEGCGEDTEAYDYSERRIQEIEGDIENLELRKAFLEEEIDEFRQISFKE